MSASLFNLSARCISGKTSKKRSICKQTGVCNVNLTRSQKSRVVAFASEAETEAPTSSASAVEDSEWVSVMLPEDLPKGVRKEVRINGRAVLMFWYRNQIYAIDARSPAEGAYSEGFIKAKFTQDFGIECPTTGSTFSLKDGSIINWYPTNPILRALTPQTGGLSIYPVKLTQDAIQVSVGATAAAAARTRGGADTSLESNNVFALQPPTYAVGSDEDAAEAPIDVATAATFTVAAAGFGIVGAIGTGICLYLEDRVLLGAFWLALLGFGAYFTIQRANDTERV